MNVDVECLRLFHQDLKMLGNSGYRDDLVTTQVLGEQNAGIQPLSIFIVAKLFFNECYLILIRGFNLLNVLFFDECF